MFVAKYPVLGRQKKLPFYLSGVGISSPEYHTDRVNGLISHQILFTVSGRGKIEIDGQEWIAEEGSVFYVASGIPHKYYPLEDDWTTHWMVFRGNYLNELMMTMGFEKYMFGYAGEIDVLEKMHQRIYALAVEPGYGDEKCSQLVYQYVMLVYRMLTERKQTGIGSMIDDALSYMDHNYRDDITLNKLSEISGVSKQYFCKIFKEKMDMRPLEYLARKRVSEAKVMLYNSDKSILEIGKSVGYQDPTYFGVVFKKYEGVSPSAYRDSREIMSI